jgi:hypothetical protein
VHFQRTLLIFNPLALLSNGRNKVDVLRGELCENAQKKRNCSACGHRTGTTNDESKVFDTELLNTMVGGGGSCRETFI